MTMHQMLTNMSAVELNQRLALQLIRVKEAEARNRQRR